MLIRFVPAASQSTIIFSLSFSHHGLPEPISVVTLMQRLIDDNLELPHDWHALDKSVSLVCLIEDLTFCEKEQLVVCRLRDGSIEEWPLSQTCSEMLHLVLSDVNEAAFVEQELKKNSGDGHSCSSDKPALSLNSFKTKHSKQRSLLMSWVSIVIPAQSTQGPSGPPPAPASSSVPSVPTLISQSSSLQLSPRALRRRARSRLVDAFRAYALPQLKLRMPKSGYYPWVIGSMLRRASLRMEELAQGMSGPDSPTSTDSWRTSVTPSLIRGDDTDFSDCDTDGSSLRTPSTHHSIAPAQKFTNPFEDNLQYDDILHSSAHAEYAAFSQLTTRLETLLHFHESREAAREREEKEAEVLLEIRSKRRAWLNKGLLQGSADWGLGSPFHSSPLARFSWRPHELQEENIADDTDDEFYTPSYPPVSETFFVSLDEHKPMSIQPYDRSLILDADPTLEAISLGAHADAEKLWPGSLDLVAGTAEVVRMLDMTLADSVSSLKVTNDLPDNTWMLSPVIDCPN